MSQDKKRPIFRRADTGRFTTPGDAKRNPGKTEREMRPVPPKPKKK